ncbi:hypothetical protein Tgr7_1730 [Thioalkalivibrio sulfidiphilus HL-EbGr7]|uniref:Uncharacterized protein n=1 Tax=Thioalkalivibrio sulfidiphilus (strain HL-EbGR7) TaxID=396588 RepID=B8GSA8_THISH|nr:hypothetical protein Tgr7_1730 [Thioalkalivibrio sulfidiphilus HL-EbGr7]
MDNSADSTQQEQDERPGEDRDREAGDDQAKKAILDRSTAELAGGFRVITQTNKRNE